SLRTSWRGNRSRPQQRVDACDQLVLARRLDDVVLGALAQAPGLVGLHALGADDQHGDGLGLVVPRQRAGRLEAIHARQDHVHQDQVGLLAAAHVDAVLGASRGQYVVAVALEQLGQDRRIGRRVLDQKNTCHWCPTPRSGVTCVRIASRSSSRVNGLVRYCSEPTIRPRALSNSPSLDDSMMTGVDLNTWLFLISAQVW